jgi:hypothetical protein
MKIKANSSLYFFKTLLLNISNVILFLENLIHFFLVRNKEIITINLNKIPTSV